MNAVKVRAFISRKVAAILQKRESQSFLAGPPPFYLRAPRLRKTNKKNKLCGQL